MYIFIFLLCVILFIFALGVLLSRNLRVRRFNIKGESAQKVKGFRIVLLSDLHGRYIGEGQDKLARAILKENPNVVIAAGDMVDAYDKNADAAAALAEKVKGRAVFIAVRGNHFYKSDKAVQDSMEHEFDRNGVISLKNQSYKAEYNNKVILIDGYDDPLSAYNFRGISKAKVLKKNSEVIKNAVEGMSDSNQKCDYKICVCHRPTDIEEFKNAGYDMMLAGHTHGGQLALPFGIEPLGDEVSLFPRKNMQSGLHYHDKMPLIITSGIGFSNIKLRTYLPPEIIVIDFS